MLRRSLKRLPHFASPNSTALAMEPQEGPSSSLQQWPIRIPSDSASNPLTTLAPGSIPTPPRKDARRIKKNGKEGAQRATRLVFNKAVCERVGVERREDFPISPATSAKAPKRARTILSNYNAARGEETHTSLKQKANFSSLKRNLERRFPALCCAESQWAADRFVQEAVRSDRKRRSRRTLRAVEPAASAEQSLDVAGTPEQRPRRETPTSSRSVQEPIIQKAQDAEKSNPRPYKQSSASLPKPRKRLRKASLPRGNDEAQRK